MTPEVKLNHLDAQLANWDYPLIRSDAETAGADIELQLADGTANLGATIAKSSVETFDDAPDLASEIMSNLPRRAVGEPYQSEGDA